MDETGVAWWTEPGQQSIYLIVDGGRVVRSTPYAESWALGHTAAQLLERGEREGATVEWIPLSAAPTLFLTHMARTRPIRRWRQDRHPLAEPHLTFGETDGGWFAFNTEEPLAWRFALASEAWAECLRRMRTGVWRRVGCRAGDDISGDPPLPDGVSVVDPR